MCDFRNSDFEAAAPSLDDNNDDTNMHFKCRVCNKGYKQRQSLYKHRINTGHSRAAEIEANPELIKNKLLCPVCKKYFSCKKSFNVHCKSSGHLEIATTFLCERCGKGFGSKQNLMNHLENHDSSTDSSLTNKTTRLSYICCHEESCSMTFVSLSNLIKHLETKHNIQSEYLTLTLDSEEDFNRWKKEAEDISTTRFVKRRGCDDRYPVGHSYYYCSRSINTDKKSESLTNKKLNIYCTSHLFVDRIAKSGKIHVRYYLKHYGHKVDLETQKSDKQLTIAKLRHGIPVNKKSKRIRDVSAEKQICEESVNYDNSEKLKLDPEETFKCAAGQGNVCIRKDFDNLCYRVMESKRGKSDATIMTAKKMLMSVYNYLCMPETTENAPVNKKLTIQKRV